MINIIQLNSDWDNFLKIETVKPYFLELEDFLKKEYSTKKIYPAYSNIFNALKYTPLKDVKAVILGQDPYINEGEAHGLAFSVMKTAKIPPSLRNIYKELNNDVGFAIPKHGCLMDWTSQGIMLLNTILTVEHKKSKSHAKKGWETFTDAILNELNNKKTPVVFMLWGNDAKAKAKLITNTKHLILQAAHPSPLANGAFFSCKHFSKTNQFLQENGLTKIDWTINE